VALQALPLESAVKGGKIIVDWQAGGARLFPVADRQIEHEGFVPFDVGVAQERDEVVADRAGHGILKVDQAQCAVFDHQIARVEITVHKNLRLLQIGRHDQRTAALPDGERFVVEFDAKLTTQIPFAANFEFTLQKSAVVNGQAVGRRVLLLLNQKINGAQIPVFCRRGIHQQGRQNLVAQIFEQDKAIIFIDRETVRHGQTGAFKPFAQAQKRLAIKLRRVGFHDNQAALRPVRAPVTTHAGIGSGGIKCGRKLAAYLGQPVFHGVQTRRGKHVRTKVCC